MLGLKEVRKDPPGSKPGQIIFTFNPQKECVGRIEDKKCSKATMGRKKMPSPLKKIPRKSKPKECAISGDTEEGVTGEKEPSSRSCKSSIRGGRKRKRGGPPVKPIDSYAYCLRKARLSVHRIKREELLLSAYQSNGWNGSSRDKVKPTAELERAMEQIEKSKSMLRECLQYCEDAHGHMKIPSEKFDKFGEPSFDAIACSKCGGLDSGQGNDILMCDGGCRLAYHEKCLDPPVIAAEIPEEQEWLCPSCTCKDEIVAIVNEAFDVSYKLNDDIKELFPASRSNDEHTTFGILSGDFPSDEEDDDFRLCDEDLDEASDQGASDGDVSQNVSLEHHHRVDEIADTSTSIPTGSITPGATMAADSANASDRLSTKPTSFDSQEILILNGKRRRVAVDYRALNDVMFGSGLHVCDDEDDQEYIPSRR
ncbi:hypothetical protein BSKO_07024 [Bryopsis sp. KO-2023]|nr:hypothetical protein BSKO_07024 [Bryopsis sp. KO-2023]